MGELYFRGVLAAYLGSNYINGPVYEWQIETVKENISKYCENNITTHPSHIKKKKNRNAK